MRSFASSLTAVHTSSLKLKLPLLQQSAGGGGGGPVAAAAGVVSGGHPPAPLRLLPQQAYAVLCCVEARPRPPVQLGDPAGEGVGCRRGGMC